MIPRPLLRYELISHPSLDCTPSIARLLEPQGSKASGAIKSTIPLVRGVMAGLLVDTRKTSIMGSVSVEAIPGKSSNHSRLDWLMIRHICTLSISNVLYLAEEGFNQQGYISLNNLTRPFWQDLLGDQYKENTDFWTSQDQAGNGLFTTALQALMDTGDRFMEVSREYAPEGRMSEQIDRYVANLRDELMSGMTAVPWGQEI
jgi:hypothetical protein